MSSVDYLISQDFVVLCLPWVYSKPSKNEDIFHQIDLSAEPNVTILEKIRRNPAANLYLLYTRQNQRLGQVLQYNDETSVSSSNFNANVPTVIVVHGWLETKNSKINPTIKDALLDSSDVNVIIMDWSRLSLADYVTSTKGVPAVGRGLGQFIEFLNETAGVSYDRVHLVGFSLGGHIVGNAGRALNGQIARITALDPAGPMWYTNDEKLRSTDAVYVEAIHTNAGVLGIEMVVGNVDFFINGGSSQPGCVYSLCNHNKSWQLFAASVRGEQLLGSKCTNAFQLFLSSCRGASFPLGNNDLTKNGTGVYFVKTRSTYFY